MIYNESIGINLEDTCYEPRIAKYLPDTEDLNWQECYEIAYKTTIDYRSKDFKYRVLNVFFCNDVQLKKWNIEEDGRCDCCNKKPDTVVHLFWSCKAIQSFWEGFSNQFS